jgi:DNA-binding transcriptional MerR regulator
MFGINASSLRYWETEFKQINPRKNKKGDRFYTLADIKLLQLIHFLLRQRKYTIEGAKEYLKKNKDEAAIKYNMIEKLLQLKSFLLGIKADL